MSFSIFSLIAVSRDIVSITFSTNFLSCSNATVPLVSVINDLGIFQVTGLIIGFQSTIFFIAYQIDILCGSQGRGIISSTSNSFVLSSIIFCLISDRVIL
ncbi:hypothetical protein HOG21_07760 [bacterium]|nr:hypothetical protein [bacterium]